ncbi:MAG: porphobilinogen synthase [Thermodesulfobacteriota bacterium]|nr:porphobilinogen synthase [Thermodesulfobacteriota bacterium]
MLFPDCRMRRLRKNERLRSMVRETTLSVNDLIYPLFVTHGKGVKRPITSMPGIFQMSPDLIIKEIEEVNALGVPAVLLFGIPKKKDEKGSEAYAKDGIIQRAVRIIKKNIPEIIVITDVCLCEYTGHGHCGMIKDGDVDNDSTLELLARMALSHVEAGADMVAPSDMMDGRVTEIRECLDENAYEDIPIMSYSAKYASSFYGPFREAVGSSPQFGDRGSYQMDPANSDEAIREVSLDVEEGADIVMVKPAIAYLDIICRVREEFDLPVAAYNVSGEYAMVKAADNMGFIDGEKVMMECLLSIKRAGADMIITYFAKEAARILNAK